MLGFHRLQHIILLKDSRKSEEISVHMDGWPLCVGPYEGHGQM